MAVPVELSNNAAQTLPEDIQKFLDSAVLGAIYVSFGNSKISKETQDALTRSFSHLQQSVLWEQNFTPDNPSTNLLIRKNLPHGPVLSHKNIQLLVTHGETSVLKFALFYGIPMLIIPFQNNQLHTAIKCTALENVSMIRTDDVTEATLSCKLNIMLNDKKFKIRAKEISELLQQKSNQDCTMWKESLTQQKQISDSSALNLHFDALGGLFFVIFVVVKVSLKFCQFYNSWQWIPKKLLRKTNS